MRSVACRLAIPLSLLMVLLAASAATADSPERQSRKTDAPIYHGPYAAARGEGRPIAAAAQEYPRLPLPPSGANHKPAKADQPVAVFVEVAIVELALKPGTPDAGVNLTRLGGTAMQPGTIERAAPNAQSRFDFASLKDGKLTHRPAGKTGGTKSVALAKSNITDALGTLASMGELRILSYPRIMVLDKQSAEMHLGGRLAYKEVTSKNGVTTETYKEIPIGTELHVRPFVAANGEVRLEVKASRTTGHLDAAGVPQTNSCQISTNVMLHDGTMLAMCDRPHMDVERRTFPVNLLSLLPSPLSLLGWIQDPNYLSYTVPQRKQTVVLLSSRIVRQK